MNPIRILMNEMMMPFLQFSYDSIYPNYAFGIILLTLMVKLILFPLTKKQFESMKQMQVLQPKFTEIRNKHKSNPQKLQEEMMKLYKKHNVNPLSGCLPMIVQLPFLLALFYTMSSDAFNELIYQNDGFPGLTSFWLPDLSQPDHLLILPLLIAGLTYWSQKYMSPNVSNPQQKAIMTFLPIFMIFICLKMPGGVLLYWAASQLISTIQQIAIMKKNA